MVTDKQRRMAAHLNLHPDPDIGGWPMDLINRLIEIEERDGRQTLFETLRKLTRRPGLLPAANLIADLIGK